MNTSDRLLEQISGALSALSYPVCPEGLYEPVAYVLGMGGKRIRPMLMLMAYSLYRDDTEKVLPAAVGLETYHNHTLLHDDLMDRADMRRGKPTVHKRWNDNTAVLSGDVMLILAFRHYLSCTCGHKDEMLGLFARTAQEICEGQQYDVNFESRTDVSVEEYLEMIRLKTSVLLACAAKTGALAAGAPEAEAEALYAFAERIGLAFQLQDDYLDVYGDPAVFGKKIGGDILCGKKTFLLVSALGRASVSQRDRLLALLAAGTMPPAEKIRAVTALYDELDIADVCNEAIGRFYAEARDFLERLDVPAERKEMLWDYVTSLLGRSR